MDTLCIGWYIKVMETTNLEDSRPTPPLSGKVALITGGSRGLGAATAQALVAAAALL